MHALDLNVPSDDTAHEAEAAIRALRDGHAAVEAVLRVRGKEDAEPVEFPSPLTRATSSSASSHTWPTATP